MEKSEAEHLLNHWIEHNEGHVKSFRERASQIEEISPEAAQKVLEAAKIMEECTQKLAEALKTI